MTKEIKVGDIVVVRGHEKDAPLGVVSHVLDDGRIALGSCEAWGWLYEPTDLIAIKQEDVSTFINNRGT